MAAVYHFAQKRPATYCRKTKGRHLRIINEYLLCISRNYLVFEENIPIKKEAMKHYGNTSVDIRIRILY